MMEHNVVSRTGGYLLFEIKILAECIRNVKITCFLMSHVKAN